MLLEGKSKKYILLNAENGHFTELAALATKFFQVTPPVEQAYSSPLALLAGAFLFFSVCYLAIAKTDRYLIG